MLRPRPAMIVLILSGLTLIVTPVAIAVAGSTNAPVTESVGDRHAVQVDPSTAATPAQRDAQPTPSSATSSALDGAWAPGVSIASVERAAAVYAPVRVDIPSLDVHARVIPVGLNADNSVEVPDDIATAGWYSLGVAPGSATGSAVLVGHRDGRVAGHGAFYDLARLSPGDAVQITDASGRTLDYSVVAREVVDRDLLPSSDLFAVDGAPRLTLITCGGYYSRDAGGYQANVIVTAVPSS